MKNNSLSLLAVSLFLTTALILSCSDDKDENGSKVEAFGCTPGAKNLCFEMPVSFFLGEGLNYNQAKAGMKENCESANDDPDYGIDVGTFYENGCPSGSIFECDCQKINSGECQLPFSKYYFYAPDYAGLTCEQIFGNSQD